jgi:hypothetical protein
MSRKRGIAWIAALTVGAPTAAIAQPFAADSYPVRVPTREKQPVPFHKKEVNLEDLFPKTEIPYLYPNPVDLEGLKVGGLLPKTTTTLGANLFVVVDNTKYATMSELYRANRIKGKSNFVTVDALMHSFLSIRNGMLAKSIEEHVAPELLALLAAMMKTTAADYKQADDAEVREDLEKNLAFLSVGVRLLDPTLPVPALANATTMATKELGNIRSNQTKRSAIFNEDEDFSIYRPSGWYDKSAKLQNFFRAKQWLSRISFALSENAKTDHSGDSFRRSALLFRALDKSVVGSQPGMQVWQHVNQALSQFGTPASTEIKTLIPSDYKEVFKATNGDLKMSLQGLAEPFYRTKLLLSVRRQRPLQISATSIFDLENSHTERATQASFRLFPIIESPETPWLRERGHQFAKEGSDIPAPPLALLDLHAHGLTQATNVLGESVWKLDPTLVTTVPLLVQALKKQASSDIVWQILASYFKMPAETIQPVLKTNNWMTRKLESGFAAWLDNQVACAPEEVERDNISEHTPIPAHDSLPPANPQLSVNAKTTTNPVPAVNSRPTLHYVEPCPEVFRSMRNEIQRLSAQLTSEGYPQPKYEKRIQDLILLLERLESIAKREVNGLAPVGSDLALLANIDVALEKFSPPTSSTIFLDTGAVNEDAARGSVTTGATIGLGHPGMLYIIFQTGRSFNVYRGAMYTYYELSGGPIKPEHWDRKMEYGFLIPPTWTEQFEIVQDQSTTGGN